MIHELKANRAVFGAAFVVATAALLFAGLAVQVTEHGSLARSDARLLHDIIGLRSSPLTGLFKVVTYLGTVVAYLVLTCAGCWYWYRRRSFVLPVAALAWMALGLSLRLAISQTIARPRPLPELRLVSVSGFAFPSGHTATATIGFGLTALLLRRVTTCHRRTGVTAIAVLAALAVGLSRSYLGAHWPADVLGGWSLGVGWVALGTLLCQLPRAVRRR